MKTYKVKALAVSGSGNNVYRSGDTVNDSNFPPGNAEELVKSGYLIPIDGSEQEAPYEKPEGGDSADDSTDGGGGEGPKEYDDISVKNLKELVEFEKGDKKPELYKKYVETFS